MWTSFQTLSAPPSLKAAVLNQLTPERPRVAWWQWGLATALPVLLAGMVWVYDAQQQQTQLAYFHYKEAVMPLNTTASASSTETAMVLIE
ncbi:MAG: hypothetical protein AB7F28_07615 [Candidatus Margulisiibacteriota bacterium]